MRNRNLLTLFYAFLILFAAAPAFGQAARGRVGRETVFALTTTNRLLTFNSLTPGTIANSVAITGLQMGESIVGIDFRPASRLLFGLGSAGRIYTINTMTGAATAAGMAPVALTGNLFGVDFNPSPDRIRVVSNMGQNLRLNPNDGTIAGTDTTVAYAMGDANSGKTPNVVSAAYTNNFAGVGATATTLYVIDSTLDILATQGSVNSAPVSPNSGQLFTVGPLGINAGDMIGFDVSDVSGTGYAAMTVAGETMAKFFTVNLATGAASLVGTITSTDQVRDIAVAVTAETLMALTAGNRIISFSSVAPGTILSTLTISGLNQGDSLLGIDFRPATGVIFGVGRSGQIYTINAATGAATKVGTPNFTLTGNEFGVDFNPSPDRIRIVSDAGQNLRLNPNDGTLAGTDTSVAYAMGDANSGKTPRIVTSAYTNNLAGVAGTATTLYGIDSSLDILVTQGSVNATPTSPNTGQLFTVAPLGVDATDICSLDISDLSGLAYAAIALPNETASRLYRITLNPAAPTTPVATLVGMIGGAEQVRAITVALRVETAFGVTSDNRLVTFNPRVPASLISSVPIAGLQMGESLLGIDYRPATGFLFGLGSTSRVYTINASTGAATQVGTAQFTPALSGMEFGVDFNPVPDRIRVTSNTGQDLRLNPNNGATAGIDTNLAYATGDTNAGQTPNIVASAYTNNFPGFPVTTLFNIDSKLDSLAIQGSPGGAPVSPNTGQLFTIGKLGIDASDTVSLDISESTGFAYAAIVLTGETSSKLFTVNLVTGAATQVGTMPIGGATPVVLRDIAIVSNVGLSLVAVGPATAVLSGSNITYALTIANSHPNPLSNVVLTTATPANTTFQSITAPMGFTCQTPAMNGTGAIVCTGSSLASAASAAFALAVRAMVMTNGTNVVLASSVKSDTPDPTGIRFDNTSASVTTLVNIPGPNIVAANIKVTNKKITATGTGFLGTTVLIDGVGFAKAAKLNADNTKLTQKGKLTNGMSINQAIPKGKAVMITFRNSTGGVTVVPFTR